MLQEPESTRYLNLDETPADGEGPELVGNRVVFEVGPKKIVTLEVCFPGELQGFGQE